MRVYQKEEGTSQVSMFPLCLVFTTCTVIYSTSTSHVWSAC